MDAPSAEPRYMKRKVKSGAIELSRDESALVVNYEVEATVLGDSGEAMQVERKAHRKTIRLTSLTDNTDIPRLAAQIVDKCKMIHASKTPHVEALLEELRDRRRAREQGADSHKKLVSDSRRKERRRDGGGGSDRTERKERDRSERKDGGGSGGSGRQQQQHQPKQQQPSGPPASMDDLDDYLELLYEDKMPAKVRATAAVLELAKLTVNLETLVQNEALMGALSRTLSEEYRRADEALVHHIARIFWSFSAFNQMHAWLSQYRVGALTMKVGRRGRRGVGDDSLFFSRLLATH